LLHRGHFYAVAADVMRREVNRVCRRIAPAQLMTGISVPTGRRLGEVQAPIAQRVVALNQRGS
jgi:hypothetical protein